MTRIIELDNHSIEFIVRSIKYLVEEHRSTCKGNCGISLFFLGRLIGQLDPKSMEDDKFRKLFI